MSKFGYLETTWRAIPSAKILVGYTENPLYAILTDGKWGSENTPVVIATNLHEQIANHIVSLHNDRLCAKTETP